MALWAVLTQQGQRVSDEWDALAMIPAVVEGTVGLDLVVPTGAEGKYWVHRV